MYKINIPTDSTTTVTWEQFSSATAPSTASFTVTYGTDGSYYAYGGAYTYNDTAFTWIETPEILCGVEFIVKKFLKLGGAMYYEKVRQIEAITSLEIRPGMSFPILPEAITVYVSRWKKLPVIGEKLEILSNKKVIALGEVFEVDEEERLYKIRPLDLDF